MSIYLRKRNLVCGSTTLAMLLLAGCGESTNIQPNSAGVVSDCRTVSANCVAGRLIDDAAFNVDYECSTSTAVVRSVTAADGTFYCPNGSDATFALINPDNRDLRIPLGSVKVTAPAPLNGENPDVPVYFYVTPRMLAGDSMGEAPSAHAINLVRLLQTLSNDTIDASLDQNLPTRRILISDADKRKITAENAVTLAMFSASVAPNPALPEANTFDAKIKPYLDSLDDAAKHQLISGTKASNALSKAIYSTTAGMYIVPGSVLTFGVFNPSADDTASNAGSMVGNNLSSGETFIGSVFALADRRGRVISHGVYSYGTPAAGSQWAIWSNPKAMDLSGTGATDSVHPLWPFDGDLTRFTFGLQGAGDVGKVVYLTQGIMRREAVAGSEFVYGNLFDETGNADLYGRFGLGTSSNASTYFSGGAYTLVHSVPVATWMDPAIWGSVSFPLPVTVSIYNGDYANPACSATWGCKMADLRMVILADGNIISDRFGQCGKNVDPVTLSVNGDDSKREIPLGTVANALGSVIGEGGSAMQTMTLLGMIPNHASLTDVTNPLLTPQPGYAAYLPYLQFGSNLGEQSLLRLDGGANQFQMYGYCFPTQVTRGQCSTSGSFAPRMASWVNNYTFMRAIKANKASDPAFDTLKVNSGGLLSAARTPAASCPP